MQSLDPRILEKLRFVKVSNPDAIDMSVFPDFLIIGPQRTGTTWLHLNLEKHPQVFMPPEKELYYFNTLRRPEFHPANLPPVSPELQWYLDFFEISGDLAAERDAECRRRFGEPFRPRVRGEATATYAAALDPEVIGEITLLAPDIKAILMVRNPVDRAWSHAKKDLSKLAKRPLESVADHEFEEFFHRWYQVKCGEYSRMVANWEPRLRPGHLFIGRFDDIAVKPEELLLDVCRFLEIDADPRYFRDVLRQRVNPTEAASIPERHRATLSAMFAKELETLAAHGYRWD